MRRRYHLGVPFWIYCGVSVLVLLAAMNRGQNLLVLVFGALMAGLLVSGVVSGSMMMNVTVRRLTAGHGVVGRPLVVRYVVTNRSRFVPVFNIHFEEVSGGGLDAPLPRAWAMHIGPGETVHAETAFVPTQRGEIRFGEVRMWTTFPFGLIRKSVTVQQRHRTLVFPRLYRLRPHVLRAIQPVGVIGSVVSAHAGAGDDYYGLREFRPGDSLRHVSWKRTANRDELICIERTRPEAPRLRVVVDLTRSTATLAVDADEPVSARVLEERAISLAASILHAADLRGFELGLTVLGFGREPFPIRRSHWHRSRLMAALAEIDLDAARLPARAIGSTEGELAGLVVIHPDRLPADDVAAGWQFTARQLDHLVEGPHSQLGPERLAAPGDETLPLEPAPAAESAA